MRSGTGRGGCLCRSGRWRMRVGKERSLWVVRRSMVGHVLVMHGRVAQVDLVDMAGWVVGRSGKVVLTTG